MNIHVRQIPRILGIDLTHKSNTATRTLDCIFALRKDSVGDLIKILDRDLQKRMQESYWPLIWCICIRCMLSQSQGFKGYCETKRIVPAREPV